MGGALSGNKKQSRCVVVGLDNSGKSTIVNYLKPEKKRVSDRVFLWPVTACMQILSANVDYWCTFSHCMLSRWKPCPRLVSLRRSSSTVKSILLCTICPGKVDIATFGNIITERQKVSSLWSTAPMQYACVLSKMNLKQCSATKVLSTNGAFIHLKGLHRTDGWGMFLLNHLTDIAKRSIPILFFANKCDLPKALTPAQISEILELSKLQDRPWNILYDTLNSYRLSCVATED